MSLALLAQAQTELRRLSVAGSRFAADDFRLKRLLDPLQAAGAKVPVFKAIGDALQALVSATKQESAAALIRASGLVSAVLATQGRHGVDGELTVLEGQEQAITPNTDGSSRRLRPVLQALTTTGSGRHTCIEDAFKDGLFADFRLLRLAVDHLEDPYPPVADCIALQVLPSFGPAVLPKLKAELDLKGGARHARALRSIHAIEKDAAFDLLAEALEEGSAEVRVAAVECLQHIEQAHALLLAHAKDKHKDVRRAIVSALGNRAGEDVIAVLVDTLQGRDYASAGQAVRGNACTELTEALVGLLPELLDKALDDKAANPGKGQKKKVTKTDNDHVRRLCLLIDLLGRRDHDAVRSALADLYARWGDLHEGIRVELLEAIQRGGGAELQAAVVSKAETFTGRCRDFAIQILFDHEPAAQVFERLSPLCVKGKRGRDAVIKALPWRAQWDERWLDFALDNDIESVIFNTLRADHAGCLQYLRTRHAKSKATDCKYLEALIQLGAEDALDLFIERVKSKSVQGSWYRWHVFHLAQRFGSEHLQTFEQIATELPDADTLAFLEAIEPLRAAAAAKS